MTRKPQGDSTLRIWAVAGPFVGLLLGLAVGWHAWGRGPAAQGDPRPDSRPAASVAQAPPASPAPAPIKATASQEAPSRPPVKPWALSRPGPRPFTTILFTENATRRWSKSYIHEEANEIHAVGPVSPGPRGVTVSDGGKLVSQYDGRTLSAEIKKSGAFTIEALVAPADTEHRGPARIVSISQDSALRNFTLGQEGDRWVVRLRTSKTGANGTNPEVSVKRLAPVLTHVVVTYDGKTERVYLNGRQAAMSTAVAGDLGSWSLDYPLVLGNEHRASRDWAGTIVFVAFYTSALSADAVATLVETLPPGIKLPRGGADGDEFF